MEIITSKSNQKIIDAKKLLDKKGREKSGLFLVETEKVIKEAFNCGLKPKCFFVLDAKKIGFDNFNDVPVFRLSDSVFKELSTLVSPDGLIAEFYLQKENPKYVGGKFLILDGVQNPDNYGAILRTALACDFKQIYTINCVDKYNPKVIRASMGNQFKLSIMDITTGEIKSLFNNASIYTASMEGKNIFDIDKFETNVGFVVGNEGNGVSKEVKEIINNTISIPMKNGVESLNASVSASVIMYYIFSKQ